MSRHARIKGESIVVRKLYFLFTAGSTALILALAQQSPGTLWAFVATGPIVVLGAWDMLQRKHTLRRIYPVIGHGRYLMEALRPEIQQYFVESNLDGTPFNREFRSIVYQRAKGARETLPFGTQRDVIKVGYEWMAHSLAPKSPASEEPRVRVGNMYCQQPYMASHLNISAMSYGSLGAHAIEALSRAAAAGGFAHNTGEGGVSTYHRQGGGDLIWQIGTGYFGCRTRDGQFDPELFAATAQDPQIKMIELKLSQGAKPAHGGILPAAKLTKEIATIRGVPLGQDVVSPPAHAAFDTPIGLLEFLAQLRELSGGKPVGFKLCVGVRSQFLGICKAMLKTGIVPDFVTVDGTEGGTGAAPMELSNSVGMPMREGLSFVHNALRGVGLRDQIRVITAGKVITAFHMFKARALGADLCNAARGMMFALGCIQSRRCNANDCPVGIATTHPVRSRALDIDDKAARVKRYHAATIHTFLELVGAAGLGEPAAIRPGHVLRRTDLASIQTFQKLYPSLDVDALKAQVVPPDWHSHWQHASAERFA